VPRVWGEAGGTAACDDLIVVVGRAGARYPDPGKFRRTARLETGWSSAADHRVGSAHFTMYSSPPARWHRIAEFVNGTEDDPPA